MIKVSFDKRIELIYGLQYCAARKYNIHLPWILENFKAYGDKFFEIYQTGITDEFEKYILSGVFGNKSLCIDLALHLDENYNLKDINSLNKKLLDNKLFDASLISNYLKEFVQKSNYEGFVHKYQKIYDNITSKYQSAINRFTTINPDMFIDIFGTNLNDIEVKLVNFISASYPKKKNNNVVCYNGFLCDAKTFNSQFNDKIAVNVIHEVSSILVSQYSQKYANSVEMSNIYNEIKANGAIASKLKKPVLLNEYLASAIHIIILQRFFPKEIALEALNKAKEYGFYYIDEIIGLFDHKSLYPSFELFYLNELVAFFSDLNDTLKKNKSF